MTSLYFAVNLTKTILVEVSHATRGVGEDGSRHLEAIPGHGQQNDRQVRPSTEFRILFEATQ